MDKAKYERAKMKRETLVDYADLATMHGIYYVFERGVKWFSRLFWALCCAALFTVAVYWIVKAYLDWQADPILTSVSTTGFPIENITFPAITICGLGTIQDTIQKVLAYQAKTYLTQKGIDWTATWKEKKTVKKNLRSINQLNNFVNDLYPGLGIDPLRIANLLSSKEPDEFINAELSQSLGLGEAYDPCEEQFLDTEEAKKRRKKREEAGPQCPDVSLINVAPNYS